MRWFGSEQASPGQGFAELAGRRYRASFPAVPSAVRACRHETLGQLRTWGVPINLDTVGLLLSEVVTNAMLHGSDPEAPGAVVSVDVAETHDGVLLSVHDEGGGLDDSAIAGDFGELAESGRGLMLVDALSESWDHTVEPGGSTVSFLVRFAKAEDSEKT